MSAQTALHHLRSSGLIEAASPQEYLFRHALVQDAAYDSMLEKDRRMLHQAVGATLEKLYPQHREELAPTLAHHFSQAGDDQRALRYFTIAGDVAYRQHALPEAIGHYSQALEIAQRLTTPHPDISLHHLYIHRGRALELNAQYDHALENYTEMEELARTQGDGLLELAALVERAKIYSTPSLAHDAQAGEILAKEALTLARQLGDQAAEARIHWILMLLNWLINNPPQSLAHGEESLRLARTLNLREQLAYTLHDLHRAYWHCGQVEQAQAALEESRQLWREIGNRPMLADNLNSAADFSHLQGRLDQALALAEEAIQISKSIGNLWNQAFAYGVMGEVYLDRGMTDESLDALQKAIDLSDQAGLVILNIRTRIDLAALYMNLGAILQGRQVIDRVMSQLQGSEAPLQTGFSQRAVGIAALMAIRSQDLETAEEILRGESPYELTDIPAHQETFSLQFLVALTEFALARGDDDIAAALIEPYKDSPPMLLLQGRMLMEKGEMDAAYPVLQKALALCEERDRHFKLWRVLLFLSKLERRRGNQDAADELRRRAQEEVEQILVHTSRPDLQASFLGQTEVQEVLSPPEG